MRFLANNLAKEDINLATIEFYFGLFKEPYKIRRDKLLSIQTVTLSSMMSEDIEEMFQ